MGLFTGLLALGSRALTVGRAAFTSAAPTLARAAPALGAAAVGGAAFQAGTQLLTGGGADPGLQVAAPSPGQAGRFVVLADGSRALLSSAGVPLRAQFFITAGAQLPGGAKIVSISPDGLLFGIRRAARKRTFRSELNRCKSVVVSADKLLTTLRKKR